MKRGRSDPLGAGAGDDEDLFAQWFPDSRSQDAAEFKSPTVVKRFALDDEDDEDEAFNNALRELASNESLIPEAEESLFPNSLSQDFEHEKPAVMQLAEEEEDYEEDDRDDDDGANYRPTKDLLSGPKPWLRPGRTPIGKNDDFVFQHVETSYVVEDTEPILRIWGCTKAGQSVLVQTKSFKPYFFVDVSDINEMLRLVDRMESYLKGLKWKDKVNRHILSIDAVQRRSMCGYHRNIPLRTMYKVSERSSLI